MSEEPRLYTTNEIEQLTKNMKSPDDPNLGNSLEAVYETTIKATFVLYQYDDGSRSFTVHFYHEDSDDPDPVFPSGDYAAHIEYVMGGQEEYGRNLGFDEIAGLLQLDPNKPVWELEEAPD